MSSVKFDSLILQALKCLPTDRVPVWMMRQAGRYLPEYQAIRRTMSFLELCKNPDKAAEVSIQPYEILGVDAIIMFSDILIPLEPMGADLSFDTGKPEFRTAIREPAQVDKLLALDEKSLQKSCDFVYETINLIYKRTNNQVPVLGFAGAPWTLASYLIEGGSSKDFHHIKQFMYTKPQAMHRLLDKLAQTVAAYLKNKLAAGITAVQLFDTWASVLDVKDYQEFALPYQQKIINTIKSTYHEASITLYVNGVSHVFDFMLASGANCLSVDWRANLKDLRNYVAGQNIAIQGNFDPCLLLGAKQTVIDRTKLMLEQAGWTPGYIANLGHGILPMTPVENARAFIHTVKDFKKS